MKIMQPHKVTLQMIHKEPNDNSKLKVPILERIFKVGVMPTTPCIQSTPIATAKTSYTRLGYGFSHIWVRVVFFVVWVDEERFEKEDSLIIYERNHLVGGILPPKRVTINRQGKNPHASPHTLP